MALGESIHVLRNYCEDCEQVYFEGISFCGMTGFRGFNVRGIAAFYSMHACDIKFVGIYKCLLNQRENNYTLD